MKLATVVQCQIACMGKHEPVCGSNERTYSNECFSCLAKVDIEGAGDAGGAASFFQGGVLGQHEYDSQKDHFFQSNSEIHHEDYEPTYIFWNEENEDWIGGPVAGSVDGWLWNISPSLEIPESDWEVADGLVWSLNSDLKLTKGELKPCPAQAFK